MVLANRIMMGGSVIILLVQSNLPVNSKPDENRGNYTGNTLYIQDGRRALVHTVYTCMGNHSLLMTVYLQADEHTKNILSAKKILISI